MSLVIHLAIDLYIYYVIIYKDYGYSIEFGNILNSLLYPRQKRRQLLAVMQVHTKEKESMYRLPLINMCNRETNRLPIAKLTKKLGCEATPPIELREGASKITPSTKFFVYHCTQDELGVRPSSGKDRFILVEVDGLKETVLDSGEANSYTVHFDLGFVSFNVTGEKLGRFAFYCSSSPEIEHEREKRQSDRFVKLLIEDHTRGIYG